ncbi:MAG: transcription elongation factor GreA [Alphaproteobacteria bacterium]|nr:transcription elongation factor GreA [Alphaproteobacteria bacterium]
MDKAPMTAAGHARLQEEIKHLKTVARPEVIAAIAEARAHGDLSENAEYHAAREKQSFIEGRVQDLEDMLARAEVIDVPSLTGSNVKFGATVKLVDEESEQEVTYQLVGEYEADLDQGRISINAPIARALIGKAVGDSVEVRTPQGERYYEVLSVEFK